MNLYRVHAGCFAASVAGKAHKRSGRAAQDAHAMISSDAALAVAVCDGCSEGARSELGAGVGARFVVASCLRQLRAGTALADVPRGAVDGLVEELGRVARSLAVDDADVVRVVDEHLLFTVQAAVVVGDRCVVFGVGDGVVSIDGDVRVIDDGPAPDYVAYALFPSLRAPKVVVHHAGAFSSSIAVATDGARELIAQEATVLGDGSALGGLSLFERDPRFVKNASLAQKRLHAWCASERGGPVDDCTIAVVRRANACDVAPGSEA